METQQASGGPWYSFPNYSTAIPKIRSLAIVARIIVMIIIGLGALLIG